MRDINQFIGYVSIIDILGFSKLLKEKNPEWVYRNIVCWLRDKVEQGLSYYNTKACEYDSESSKCGGWEHSSIPIKFMFFADTIVLYVEVNNDWGRIPKVMFYTLSNVLSMLLTESLKNNILLRGSVSYGNILTDKSGTTILGSCVSEAHELEVDQEWIGITVCESMVKQTLTQPFLSTDRDYSLGDLEYHPHLVKPKLYLDMYTDEVLINRDYFWHMQPKLISYPSPLKNLQSNKLLNWVISWAPDINILNPTLNNSTGRERIKIQNTIKYARAIGNSPEVISALAKDDWNFSPARELWVSDDYASTRPLDEGYNSFIKSLETINKRLFLG